MAIFSFHLVETTPLTTLKTICVPPKPERISGLRHIECMSAMSLGAPIASLARMQLRNLAVFAVWEDQESLDGFLAVHQLGQTLSDGWYVRLELLRRWGKFSELDEFPVSSDKDADPNQPVVVVTLARLKLPELTRFIHWGKPVEIQVKDHPGTQLALAAIRLPNTFSTFSIWRDQQEMVDTIRGNKSSAKPSEHAEAMKERNRKEFHYKFTTLRFRTLAEHGEWQGRSNIVSI